MQQRMAVWESISIVLTVLQFQELVGHPQNVQVLVEKLTQAERETQPLRTRELQHLRFET